MASFDGPRLRVTDAVVARSGAPSAVAHVQVRIVPRWYRLEDGQHDGRGHVRSVMEAIRDDVSRGKSPRDAGRYRRAAMILETSRDLAHAQEERGALAPDVLDEDIRTKKTLDEVRAESSPISRHWNIVSIALTPVMSVATAL